MISALNRSLYIKQSLATLALAVVLSFALSFVQAYQTLQQEPYRIQKEFNDILSIVERPLSQALFRLDTTFAQQQAESLLYNPAIQQATVFDENGQVFAQAKAPSIAPSISNNVAGWLLAEQLSVSRQLNFSEIEFPLGSILLELDRRYLVEQIISVNTQLFAQNLVKDILLALLLSFLFYAIVTRPVKQLTWSLARVDEANGVSVPGSFNAMHRNDELGRLKNTFNELWLRLTKALDALDRSHQHSKAMITHAADGIVVLNHSLHIQVVNGAAEKLLHKTAEELTSAPLASIQRGSFWTSLQSSLKDLPVDQVMTAETTLSNQQKLVPVEIRISKYEVQGETELVLLMLSELFLILATISFSFKDIVFIVTAN